MNITAEQAAILAQAILAKQEADLVLEATMAALRIPNTPSP